MYSIKKFFRNIPTGMLMILGFSILMFLIFNIVSLLKVMDIKNSDKYRYNQELSLSIFSTRDDYEINSDELVFGKGNIYINNESAYIDEINMKTVVLGLVQYEEGLKRKLSVGEYPSFDMDDSEPLAVVGYDIYKEANIKGKNRYITILGVEYKIVGVLQKEAADNIDYTVIAFIESLKEKDRSEYIRKSSDNYTSYYCDYQSDNCDYRKDVEVLSNKLRSEEIELMILDERLTADVHSVNNSIDSFKEKTIYLVALFCLFNCFAITNLWIRNRYIELSIRKAYGYNTIRISILLVKDLIKYMIISVVFGFAMQTVYNVIKGTNLINETVLEDSVAVLLMGIIVVLITVALQLSKVMRIAPASSIKEVL